MKVIRDKATLPILGSNVKNLRTDAGLTTEGLTAALEISRTSLLTLEKGEANISPRIARKIAKFFGIKIDRLYIDGRIPVSKNLPTIKAFYKKNKDNPRFFIQRRSEYKVAAFLKTILINDPFIHTRHTIREIREYCNEKYEKKYDVFELSRELRRMYLKDIIHRERKNDAMYFYWLKAN